MQELCISSALANSALALRPTFKAASPRARWASHDAPTTSLQQRQRPFSQIKEHFRIRQLVLRQSVDLDAVLPETGVTRFDCYLAEVRHRKAPLTIRCATSYDKTTARFSLHAAQPTRFYFDGSVFLLRGWDCGQALGLRLLPEPGVFLIERVALNMSRSVRAAQSPQGFALPLR